MYVEEWLRITLEGPAPELTDPAIKWERGVIRGHPTHPVSGPIQSLLLLCSCFALALLLPEIQQVYQVLTPKPWPVHTITLRTCSPLLEVAL